MHLFANYLHLKNHMIPGVPLEDKESIERLMLFFNRFGTYSKKTAEYLIKNSSLMHVRKNDIVISPGTTNPKYYFILNGVLRGYITRNNREITTWINWEDGLISTIRNLGKKEMSEETVQALEDGRLIVFSADTIEYLYEHFPETNRIARLIVTENLRHAEERAFIARLSSAEERYDRFMKTSGELTNRISLKHIASYLNMKLETLSRIRSRKT